jgi:hypothetical protein
VITEERQVVTRGVTSSATLVKLEPAATITSSHPHTHCAPKGIPSERSDGAEPQSTLGDPRVNSVQQAIREAAEKGGYRYRSWKVNDLEPNEGYNALQLRALPEHLHNPDFWKALATARKWQDVNAWRFHWHRFIDHLADGGDVESFFAAL